MALLDKTGISDGSLIRPEHITRLYDTLNGEGTYEIKATGSFSGSLNGTASFAVSSSRTVSASFSATASYVANALNATTAGTATNANNIAVTDTVTGTGPYYITFVDASTGNDAVRVDSTSLTYNATTNTIGATASYAVTASYVANAGAGVSSSYAVTASHALTTGATNAISSSYAVTASYVANAGISSSYAVSSSRAGIASIAASASITNTQTDNAVYYITFVEEPSGNEPIRVDSNVLTYNPSTNIMTTTSSYAVSSSRAVTSSFAVTASHVPNAITFPYTGNAIITGSLIITGGITGSLQGTATTASVANQVAITSTNVNSTGYVTFTALDSGNNTLYIDSTTTGLLYTPFTNILTVTASRAVTASHALTTVTASYAINANVVAGWTQVETGSYMVSGSWTTIWAGTLGSGPFGITALAFKAKVQIGMSQDLGSNIAGYSQLIDYHAVVATDYDAITGGSLTAITFTSSSLPTLPSNLYGQCRLFDGGGTTVLFQVQHQYLYNTRIAAAIEYKDFSVVSGWGA